MSKICHFDSMTSTKCNTTPIVTLEEGQIEGKSSQNHLGEPFLSFLGIPYAEPPIGDLRFKAPIPKKPWQGLRKAVKQGPPCPSRHLLFRYYVGSEANCLHLNIFTRDLPRSTNGPLKPVMVWIHGGAFIMGCNEVAIYGPEYLMTEDIVLVTINYRLGVLGFLSLENPSLGVPGNAGMKDMILALQWVQKNIEQFCGNPKNVTIFGLSAGAAAAHFLCMSPMAKGLFHKVIAQSGCVLNGWAQGCGGNGQIIAGLLGYKETEEAKILQYLRRLSPRRLVIAQQKELPCNAGARLAFGPVVEVPSNEPAFLLEEPEDILRKGTFSQVPMIMGYNSEEALMMRLLLCLGCSRKDFTDFEKDIPFDLKLEKDSDRFREVARRVGDFYFNGEDITRKNIQESVPLKSDIMFVHGVHRSVNFHRRVSECPIYFYKMTVDTSLNMGKRASISRCVLCYGFFSLLAYHCSWRPLNRLLVHLMMSVPQEKIEGVSHGDEVNYLFKTFAYPKLKRGSMEELSVMRFVKLWTNFARTGNPTPTVKTDLINVSWYPVNSQKNYFLEIGSGLKMGSDPDWERMKFWDSLYNE